MAREYKCNGYCEGKYILEDMVSLISNRKKYCKPCAEKFVRDNRERKELYDYIKKVFDITFPTGLMQKQISNFYKVNEYTYGGMLNALKYFCEVQGNQLYRGAGVGIISFVYDEAQEHYKKQEELANKHVDSVIETKVITITKVDDRNYFKEEMLRILEE